MRNRDDFYETPAWCTELILPHLTLTGSILEPACGANAILDLLPGHAWGCDINPRKPTHMTWKADFLTVNCHVDLIISNPPFSLAEKFVRHALTVAHEVAFLLRLSFLGAQERNALHRDHPSDVYVLPKRPSFAASIKCKKKCGYQVILALDVSWERVCPSCGAPTTRCTSDASEYGWFVWGAGRGNRWYLL